MKKEIWKPVKHYEKEYDVSSYGRIWSKDRILIKYRNGHKIYYHMHGQYMHPYVYKNGYFTIHLRKRHIRTQIKVHRLVAREFIPNPHNYPCVNHKNENKLDNKVSNLEWCTPKYNTDYSIKMHPDRKNNTLWLPIKKCSVILIKNDKNYYFSTYRGAAKFINKHISNSSKTSSIERELSMTKWNHMSTVHGFRVIRK